MFEIYKMNSIAFSIYLLLLISFILEIAGDPSVFESDEDIIKVIFGSDHNLKSVSNYINHVHSHK